ncbi:hypothetical protein BDV19DRAFT_391797 [Aspergillus venezuelensis]
MPLGGIQFHALTEVIAKPFLTPSHAFLQLGPFPFQRSEASVYLGASIIDDITSKQVIAHGTKPLEEQLPAPRTLCHHSQLKEILENKDVTFLQIKLRNHKFNASNLFNGHAFGDGKVDLQPFRDYFLSSGTLSMFVVGTGFQDALAMEKETIDHKRAHNPLNAWYPRHPQSHFIEPWGYAEPSKRPKTQCEKQVEAKFLDSAATFEQSLSALRKMIDDAHHPRRNQFPQTSNMCKGIRVPGDYCQSNGFNVEQISAFNSLYYLPGGVGLFHGPPGTRKAWWLILVMLPILAHVLEHPNERRQVLLVGPSNTVADALATKMDSAVREAYPGKAVLVVRCHTVSTEENLVIKRAATHRTPAACARPPILNSEPMEEAVLDEMLTAHTLATHHANQTRTREGVSDQRLKEVELSLGHRMLQLAGVIPLSFSNPKRYEHFGFAFRNYLECPGMDCDDWICLRANLRMLRDDMLQRADVVVCTAFSAGCKPITQNVFPTAIGVDEAGKLLESEMWPVLAYYNPQGLFLACRRSPATPTSCVYPFQKCGTESFLRIPQKCRSLHGS